MLHPKEFTYSGKPVKAAKKIVIMIHGRGGTATDLLQLKDSLKTEDFAFVAPQAYNNSWYPLSFMAPEEQNQPWLNSALDVLSSLERQINEEGIASEDIFFFGFSQGACLALEYTARNAKKYGGLVAIIGGLIGDKINTGNYISDFGGTPIYLGTSDPDAHVPVERVRKTAEILKNKNAEVKLEIYKNKGHRILTEELGVANNHVFGYPGPAES